jgi:hypothetical protein
VFYNDERPHQALDYRTPSAVFYAAAYNHVNNATPRIERGIGNAARLSLIISHPDSCPTDGVHLRPSAPIFCFGTLASRFWPLVLLPLHQKTGSCSSVQKPVSGPRPLYAGRRPHSHQASRGLVSGEESTPDFDDT